MSSTENVDLIPVRALNQVTYCPRLYFLQYVEAVCPSNEHIEGGLFDHRRITAEELAGRTRKERDALQTRSVTLSSDRLGVTGVLDVVEERGGAAYPVETKHGSAPRDETGSKPTFWDNDAVQLCAQGMLLEEELGQPVPRGVLFYAGSRERVEVALDEALRAKTLAAIALIRELSKREGPPEPLGVELRHRCHGCSLAPVCLPEETLYQIGLPAGGAEPEPPSKALTCVIPKSDHGAVLYLQEPGSRVGKRSEHLTIHKDGQELNRVPMHAVRQVVLMGNVQISTQALETLVTNEIPVMLLSGYGRFIASVMPAPAKNVSLRSAQFARFADAGEALKLAKEVVRAKLMNQRTLLMRWLRGKGEAADESGTRSEEPAARDIAELLTRLDGASEVESVLGLEGQGASLYFGEFGRFLKATPGGTFDFKCRNRRPPRDAVNALLSFAYSLLVKDCFSAVCTVGFDPYCGFYHKGRHGRPSLALDLMEEFRPVIGDSVVLGLVNNKLVEKEDFVCWRDAWQLTESGRKKFFGAYEMRKATEIRHPVYGYTMTYSRMLEVQARMLAAYVRGDIPRYTGFTVR